MSPAKIAFNARHLLAAVLVVGALRGAPAPIIEGATPSEWSLRMARAELERRGEALEHSNPKARWDYTSGLFATALMTAGRTSGDRELYQAGIRIVSSFVGADGSIATYRGSDYNLDMVAPGRALLMAYEAAPSTAIRTALLTLRDQLAKQPRTSDGGFWHKQRYPYQMWLDGLYMAEPFYANYARVFAEPADFDDVASQFLLVDKHLYDPAIGLYRHAWDEKHVQPWASSKTGCSASFWGRAEGWYAMALADVVGQIPPTHPEADALTSLFVKVADGLVRWQDPKSGVWWQVLDQGDREGNYLEATASSMFVYALAKGINQGYLPRERFLPVVRRGYEGLIREFVRIGADGRPSLTHCCEVAGLGYTNGKGRSRDGSFGYYVSEPVVENDLKGIGPFILAGLEVEKAICGTDASLAAGWAGYSQVLASIKAPAFPAREFPITDFGARAGADVSDAVRKAIQACHNAGGGHVVVPAGEWIVGSIHLLSNVDLHLMKGSTLLFSTDPKAYLPVVFTRWEGTECMNYSALIYAYGQENIAVTGEGTLDGGASDANWWGWKRDPQRAARNRLVEMGETGVPVEQRVFGEGSYLRPNFFQPYRCRNVLIEGVRIVRSPMWEINPVLCANVTVRSVRILSHGPNNDGCDPESCDGVLIEKCEFDTGDDCIAIKSGRNNDGRRVGVPAQNIVVRDCVMKDGHGGVVVGSEISGGARNIFVENCRMDSPNLDRALRLKSNAQRGGVIENVFMRDVTVGRVAEAILTVDFLYEEGAKGKFPPTVRNVRLERVTSSASPRILWIAGFKGATIEDIRITDCRFAGLTQSDRVEEAGAILFDRVKVEPSVKGSSIHTSKNK